MLLNEAQGGDVTFDEEGKYLFRKCHTDNIMDYFDEKLNTRGLLLPILKSATSTHWKSQSKVAINRKTSYSYTPTKVHYH